MNGISLIDRVTVQFRSATGQTHNAAQHATMLRRYANVVTTSGWIILSILAHSQTFRNACCNLNEPLWEALVSSIHSNSTSLELFFRVRRLDWISPLYKVVSATAPQLLTSFADFCRQIRPFPYALYGKPHSYIVPNNSDSTIRQPQHNNRIQVEIQDSIWTRQHFITDPMALDSSDGPCFGCDRFSCDCNPQSCPKIIHPLVELRQYGNKGVGIRTLQRIKKGDILDEYVGQLLPEDAVTDQSYCFGVDRPTPAGRWRRRPNNNNNNNSTILIDAQEYGNWTRFINASCNPSTTFVTAALGNRLRVMVVATRDIEMFEELTIGYGDGFWLDGPDEIMCECSESNCRYASSKAKERVRMCKLQYDVEMEIDCW